MNSTLKLIFLLMILSAISFTSCNPTSKYDTGKGITLELSDGTLSVIPLNSASVRVKYANPGSEPLEELIYTEESPMPQYRVEDNTDEIVLAMERISVVFNKNTETLTFKNKAGNIILQEKAGGRLIENSTVQEQPTYKVEQHFLSPEDEYLYGTGQFQDGYLNIRGLTRRLTQVNTQISIPFILSNKGYGLLWNNYGLTDFNPATDFVELKQGEKGKTLTVDATSTTGNKRETRSMNTFTASMDIPSSGHYSLLLDVGQKMARKHFFSIDGKNIIDINNTWLPPTTSVIMELSAGKHDIIVEGVHNDKPSVHWRRVSDETVFSSPVAQALDYTVFAGTGDEVIASYRELTGAAPMMPLWALGYIHCRERYHTQEELLENAREFRKRGLPIDMIVQDWQYWGKYGWNAMCFDEGFYPDPARMVNELHDMNIRLMISVWSKIDKDSEVGKLMTENGYYIPESDWIDFFNPKAAAFYWKNFNERLLQPYKIDAWWQDATEPENDDLQHRRINNGQTPGELFRNVYPLYVSKTIYEGLRKDNPEKRRAMIFTRSGFSGMQRYAAATWSGDVGHDWETLRRQITGGLGQMATGLPWWTYDAGGFFRPGDQYNNKEYHEQFIRWLQASTFFPLMRVHGYMSNTEPWRYGKDVEEIVTQYLKFRYRMLPYIYSVSANVSFDGYTLMRPLVMDFPSDKRALEQRHQFMFGPSLLVAPVTEPAVKKWSIYLPEYEAGWFDFWNGEKIKGGQTIDTDVDIRKAPLFVKAGSIIPLGNEKQYTSEKSDTPYEIRIYPGVDARFTIYEDEGENYNYEQGKYCTFNFIWNDAEQRLEITERKGEFSGMQKDRTFNVVMVSPGLGTGFSRSLPSKLVKYLGKTMEINM